MQNDILEFENDWNKLKRTLLYEMKSGFVRHPSGRLFNNKEIKYAENNNSRPNYSIRIEKYFSVKFITDLKKKIVPYFSTEISKLTNLIKFVIEV